MSAVPDDAADLWRAVNRHGIEVQRVALDPGDVDATMPTHGWRARTPGGVWEYGLLAEDAVRAVVQSLPR